MAGMPFCHLSLRLPGVRSGENKVMETPMPRLLSGLVTALDTFGAAARAAAAVRSHRCPDARDLRRLGIDAEAMRGIRV